MTTTDRVIGVLTSGGDAPGMNAAIRAVVLAAISRGYKVMGVKNGYKGLIEDDLIELNENNIADVIERAGTFLRSDRCDEFQTEEGMNKALATCEKRGIVGLVCLGGDGTFRGATEFSQLKYSNGESVNCIGLPLTIDNDISMTDYTIGFDSAASKAMQILDELRHTCDSHYRCNVVELMGRAAGDISLNAGLAAGAQVILLKEVDFDRDRDFPRIAAYLEELRKNGRTNFLVVVAEGIPLDLNYGKVAEDLAKYLNENTSIETKFCRPAHILRGVPPTMRDRKLASEMGAKAVELLADGQTDKVVCLHGNQIVAEDINYALAFDRMYKLMLNAPYAESGRLNEKEMKKYYDNQKKFSAAVADYSPEKLAEMKKLCEEKLAAFRAVYETAVSLSR